MGHHYVSSWCNHYRHVVSLAQIMTVQTRQLWARLASSYWFLPSILTLGAMVLALVMIQLDALGYTEWVEQLPWSYLSEPEGARAVLSTIATSMMTVAGVTFSITIVAVVYASSQFGPRLLTNFMQDHGNQLTLGTFIGTFLYCLLVLRTVRQVEGEQQYFVPQLALFVAFLLTLMSVVVFIYYVHHVPESIHISSVTGSIGKQMLEKIDDMFPEMIGRELPDGSSDNVDLPEPFYEQAVPIPADGHGYVQFIDERALIRHAQEKDVVLRVVYSPGDFVMSGKALAYAWPADPVDDAMRQMVNGAFAWGRRRTQRQDLLFLVNELVEIAIRALSPSVNDPMTASTCLDWLGSGLRRLARQDRPDTHRFDAHDQLRLIVQPVSFEQFAETAYGQLRPYAANDANAALHMMKTIADMIADVENEEYRQTLIHHARLLLEEGRETLGRADVSSLEDRYHIIVRLRTQASDQKALASKHRWLSGSG